MSTELTPVEKRMLQQLIASIETDRLLARMRQSVIKKKIETIEKKERKHRQQRK